MTKTILATWENGVFRPLEPVDLPEHSPARVQVETNSDLAPPTLEGMKPPMPWKELQKYVGTIKPWPEDPVEWQRKMRDEEWL